MTDRMHRELRELSQLHQRLREDDANEERIEQVRREMHEVERRIDEAMHRREAERHERPEHEMERIEHLHAAADHLRHAGIPELARRAIEHAEEIERDLDQHRGNEGHPRGPDGMMREVMEQVDALRREVQGLREQIGQMQRDR